MRISRPKAALSVYDLTLDELSAWMRERGFPAFRAKQLYDGLYRQLAASYDDIPVLPKALRERLAEDLPIAAMVPVNEVATPNRDTVKTLYETATHDLVETVLMVYRDRATVCVSCQVGCAVGCAFCATGLMGLQRNLTTGQMVAQVVGAARSARAMGRPLTNLVMMGMGEPFHNYPATMKFLGILNDPAGMGMGARRMTISTSGVVPFIEKLAEEPLQVNLAISLHAPNQQLRESLVPIARKHPLDELLEAVDSYTEKTHRRISFEYALMSGINDADEIALELAELMRGRLVHLNVIPFNKVDVLEFERPTTEGIDRFAELAGSLGTPVTVRYSRGLDISAACGQLRSKVEAGRRAGEQASSVAS
ncbi:MAG: 23S rRNA (adenine(2503)-C(2))-methyltransferase RlmN [Chloroflexota bacterium]|nr:23S rRNA (adenine(2503)-C(2))-methyltransferase RlmN [Chloroflexota bacterium]